MALSKRACAFRDSAEMGAAMSSNEATIITAARVWARTLAELEEAKRQVEADGEVEVAMHEIAARVEALKSAELMLYQAVQLSA